MFVCQVFSQRQKDQLAICTCVQRLLTFQGSLQWHKHADRQLLQNLPAHVVKYHNLWPTQSVT